MPDRLGANEISLIDNLSNLANDAMRFGILKKFLIAFLVLSLVPLLIVALHAYRTIVNVGHSAVDNSRKALIEHSTTLLVARASAVAHQVEEFLYARRDDLKSLALLPTEPQVYLAFSRSHQRQIWIRGGTRTMPQQIRRVIPIYREITYTNELGIEEIHIAQDRSVATARSLKLPFRSNFGQEDYFNQARSLPRGKIYVSHLVGRHVRSAEQLQGAQSVEDAYGGVAYSGIIRFAIPVYRDEEFKGVVSLALDHQHLMEFTQHVLPIGSDEIVFPSYASGNYAFMFDDEGWIITHPKFWDIRGYDRDTGLLVDPQSPQFNAARMKAGLIPFNLLHVAFIHPNYRHIALEVLNGKSGMTSTYSVGGVSRVLAFAPIRFGFGEYRKSGFFGGVTLGAQTNVFHQAVDATSDTIREALQQTVKNFGLIILLAGLFVASIAVLIAKSFTRPIHLLAEKANQIGQGNYEVSVNIMSGDELEILGQNFDQMGRQLQKHQQRLMDSLSQLETSKKDIENYNLRLRKQVDILKHIHYISNFLSVNFDQAEVIKTILKTCVEGLGFDRALLYLHNTETRVLECVSAYGFTPTDEKRALGASYQIEQHDCVPTRVFIGGEPIRVDNAQTDTDLTDLDRKIASLSGIQAFAFAPIRTTEQIIGVLGADYATTSRPIGEEEMESLKILANETAMGIERARLMDEAVSERDFIESIFSNMMSGLLVVDQQGCVRAANPKACQLLKIDSAGIIEQPVGQALVDYPPLCEQIELAMSHPGPHNSDFELILPDGSQQFFETTVHLIQGTALSGDNPVILIFRDITGRKKMEKLLRRSDRLVSLGTLAAGIAHEIRNPLTGISLMLDDLHDRLHSRPDERFLMQRALQEIEKLESIVTELLEFAKSPTSRLVPKDLDQILEHTLFLVNKQCKQAGIILKQHTHDPLPPVLLDPEKMKQALLNILLNAINFTPNGGRIDVTTELKEDAGILAAGRCVEVAIADTGPGVDPDDIEFIFDPFFTRNPNGFGLGLSITHTIIEEHQGKIVVENETGKGACFKIFLPVARGDL